MGFCTASIEHLQHCSLAYGLNVAVIVVTVIWGLSVGGRDTSYSVCRERDIRRVKTKKRKKKDQKNKTKQKGGGGGGAGSGGGGGERGRTVEVMNNESVDKIYHEPKNKWLKLYER